MGRVDVVLNWVYDEFDVFSGPMILGRGFISILIKFDHLLTLICMNSAVSDKNIDWGRFQYNWILSSNWVQLDVF